MYERASLLVNEHPLQVLPSLAAIIGLNESLFLQQLYYWLQQKPHLRDGTLWVYNTINEWQLQFPFWSDRTIRRVVQSLKKQGLIKTTDQYNRVGTDRKLWYAIEYENLQKLGLENVIDSLDGQCGLSNSNKLKPDNIESKNLELDNVDASIGQPSLLDLENGVDSSGRGHGQCGRQALENPELDNVDASTGQPSPLDLDNMAVSRGRGHGQPGRQDADNGAASIGQHDPLSEANMTASTGQHDLREPSTLADTLYGTETTTETTAETTTETTTTTATQDLPADSVNPPEDVVVVLVHHGISSSIAHRFAQKYPQEYLLEKIEFLEFEKTRMPNLANPAGWLRRAIEEDFAKPSGFQTASEIEAQQVATAQREAALLEKQRAEHQAMVQAEEARSKAKEAAEADKVAAQLALVQPSYGTTEALLRAWEEGVRYVAKSSLGDIQMLMDGLKETVLLTFENGHAQIGTWDGPAHHALQLRGKQFLKECLAYAMRDTLGGRSGTYELVLLGVD